MKLGAERKKVVVLVALVVVAAATWYYEFSDTPSAAAPPHPASAPAAQARQVRSAAEELLDRPVPKARSASIEFKPSLKLPKPGEGPDPDKVDPTLRTDLLAKVQAVEYQGAERNLFQFGIAKPKLTPQQIETAKKEAAAAAQKLAEAAKESKPAEPSKPVAPPVTMKYFGYVNRPGDARRRAFLMDGEDILVTYEGDVIKKRYRVVRIGISSLVVEDLQFHSEQTLPLQENS